VAIGVAVRHLMKAASKSWERDEDEEGEEEFAEGEDEEELALNTFRHIMIRQSGHGQRVAQAHYAIDGAFLHRLGPELMTVFEQASVAWHELWHLQSEGTGKKVNAKHGREASQQLTPGIVKRERVDWTGIVIKTEPTVSTSATKKALAGLRRIYGPTAKPQSEGQAAALELVHHPPRTSVIVLPTVAHQ
jgi:hypothetical protein